MKQLFRHWIPAYAGMTTIFFFSFFLMFHTFSAGASSMYIATKAWSDFGSHIPLVRSFSMGDNLPRLLRGDPPEHPLFPGVPIRYHFLFYALVGLLEKAGLGIDWALNIPSALGFFFLIVMMWILAKELFGDTRVAVLSVLFFLFNGSLSFLNFFKIYPLSFSTPLDIITNAKFPSFGPWDGGNITAFWTLNIYTNQRHLGLSFSLSLFVLFLILRKKYGVLPGVILGLLLFINQAAAGITMVFSLWFFIIEMGVGNKFFGNLKSATRRMVSLIYTGGGLHLARQNTNAFDKRPTERPKNLVPNALITILIFFLFFFLLARLTTLPSGIVWQPGYLVPAPLTVLSFFTFWFFNLGLHVICIPLGLILAPRRVTKLFLVPLLILFVLPNLFRFSPDMINNHKFFNFFMLLGSMFSAYTIIQLINYAGRHAFSSTVMRNLLKTIRNTTDQTDYPYPDPMQKPQACLTAAQQNACRTAAFIFIFFLTFSGIIDLFPILNDTKIRLADIHADPDIRFFATIPSGSIVANSTWFYHPASLAGRPIFNGYSYFTWSYGYDQTTREQQTIALYQSKSREDACMRLKQSHISYLELSKNPESFLKPNTQLWQSLPAVYHNPATGMSVYEITILCH